jgi:uncharacterized membrane protein YvbJ
LIKCQNCGTEIKEGNYCPECGSKIENIKKFKTKELDTIINENRKNGINPYYSKKDLDYYLLKGYVVVDENDERVIVSKKVRNLWIGAISILIFLPGLLIWYFYKVDDIQVIKKEN